jgi:hypothetical protein
MQQLNIDCSYCATEFTGLYLSDRNLICPYKTFPDDDIRYFTMEEEHTQYDPCCFEETNELLMDLYTAIEDNDAKETFRLVQRDPILIHFALLESIRQENIPLIQKLSACDVLYYQSDVFDLTRYFIRDQIKQTDILMILFESFYKSKNDRYNQEEFIKYARHLTQYQLYAAWKTISYVSNEIMKKVPIQRTFFMIDYYNLAELGLLNHFNFSFVHEKVLHLKKVQETIRQILSNHLNKDSIEIIFSYLI